MKTGFFLSTVVLSSFLLLITGTAFAYSGGLSSKEARQLALLRQAGLSGDKSQVASLRNIIENPYATNTRTFAPSIDELLVVTALRSLTRLNAVEAIPDVDKLLQQCQPNYPDLANFAVVQKARLESEQGTDGSLSEQIVFFYKSLNLTPHAISKGAAEYKEKYYASPEGRRLPVPVEVYAMREVAEMVYQAHPLNLTLLPGVSQIDFSLDYASALKIRLASLPEQARVEALIDSLAHAQVLGQDEDYNMQLLADEGQFASQAIVAQLDEMSRHRNQYLGINFTAFFRVLTAIGNPQPASVTSRLQTDPDLNVRKEAGLLSRNLQAGLTAFYPHAAEY